MERRKQVLSDLIKENDTLVYAQEYLAEFVDWAGLGFFSPDKWLVNGAPVSVPQHCDAVFAVIDTAVKTGYEHDGTAVVYHAVDKTNPHWKLTILDLDVQHWWACLDASQERDRYEPQFPTGKFEQNQRFSIKIIHVYARLFTGFLPDNWWRRKVREAEALRTISPMSGFGRSSDQSLFYELIHFLGP